LANFIFDPSIDFYVKLKVAQSINLNPSCFIHFKVVNRHNYPSQLKCTQKYFLIGQLLFFNSELPRYSQYYSNEFISNQKNSYFHTDIFPITSIFF
jgi:hypothetical protein